MEDFPQDEMIRIFYIKIGAGDAYWERRIFNHETEEKTSTTKHTKHTNEKRDY